MFVAMVKGVVSGGLYFSVGIGLLALFVGAPLGYFGVFGQTGADYFQECWERHSAEEVLGGKSRPRPSTARQALKWGLCEPTTLRAVYGAGLILVSLDAEESLYRSCPPSWTQSSFAELHPMTIKLALKAGGPSVIDHFLPARFMVERLWVGQWPQCSTERRRLGRPQVVESTPGVFTWERPCLRC